MTPVPNDGLDDVDRRLLELLAADARISNARLAAAVGVAPSTALARVRALRARGVIRGFHAEAGGVSSRALFAVGFGAAASGFTAACSQPVWPLLALGGRCGFGVLGVGCRVVGGGPGALLALGLRRLPGFFTALAAIRSARSVQVLTITGSTGAAAAAVVWTRAQRRAAGRR